MGEITYVLDVDHDSINTFDEVDEKNLSLINDLIVKII
jgi:putative methionine-R-sulfoxide reductase with GAF domain